MAPDVMIDLETLSTRPNAAIISIGACTFTRGTGEIHERLHVRCSPNLKSYDVDLDTIRWWFKQSEAARLMHTEEAMCMGLALHELLRFIRDATELASGSGCLWAMPAAFDITILENSLRVEAIKVPWKYNAPRCLRTLCEVAELSKDDRVKATVEHDALADCVAQVGTLFKCLQKLGKTEW